MEKEQKQELGWRVSVLPIPAFHHCEPLCVACTHPGEKDRAITRSDAVGVVNRGFTRSHAIQRQTPRQTAA